jgi:hypothetical protein
MALVNKNFSDIITFTRASTGTFFNSAGVLTSAAINAPRFDYNPSTLAAQGLLIEESRTNSIRNNTMVGAVAGTPGTLPTNWSVFTSLTGLTQTIVGTGVENGITYIEIRLNGTPSAAGTYQWYTEAANGVPATVGQTWTLSQFFKLQAGTLSGVSLVRHFFEERSSGGSYLTEQSITAPNPTTAALSTQRSSATRTLTDAACAFLRSGFNLALTGAAIDITLRIGLPQLELGAFATSVIPTTTTALTRAADVASVNTLSPWYNATEGTLYVQAQDMSDAAHATSQPRAVSINNGTSSNTIDVSRIPASAQGRARIDDAGVSQFNSLTTAWPLATQAKVALAYKLNDAAACLGGGTVFTDNTVTIPTTTLLSIGAITTGGANGWVGWIQRITYYPTRLSNAQLQAITT